MIDYTDKRPLYEKIKKNIEDMIVSGVYPPDMKLQSVRALALEMAINPNTIQRALSALEDEGYIYSITGKGNFVNRREFWQSGRQERLEEKLKELLKEARDLCIDKKYIDLILSDVYEGRE